MRLWYKVSGILFDISFMASLNDSESLKYSPNAFKMANVCILNLNNLYHMKQVYSGNSLFEGSYYDQPIYTILYE